MSTNNYSEEAGGFDWTHYWDGGTTSPPSTPTLRSRNTVSPDNISVENGSTVITVGNEELLPEHLLFMPAPLYFSRELDPRLMYTQERRPVLEPLRFRVSSEEYLLWGAAIAVPEEGGEGIDLGSVEEAEKRVAPATSPPVAMIWIATEDGAMIQIKPRTGMSFVTVADVQEAVVHWMEESRDEMEVQELVSGNASAENEQQDSTWMWHGLVQLGQRLDAWELRR